jgi:hypothetical protein
MARCDAVLNPDLSSGGIQSETSEMRGQTILMFWPSYSNPRDAAGCGS